MRAAVPVSRAAAGFASAFFTLAQLARAADRAFHRLDLAKLTEEQRQGFKEQEQTIVRTAETETAKIQSWHEAQKEEIRQFKERKEKEFAAHTRKMHCNKLKKNLVAKAKYIQKEAKQTMKQRKQKAAEAKAVERAREILSKSSEQPQNRMMDSLGEEKLRVDPVDAKYWLKAIKTNDPQWQHRENERLRHIQRTDGNWRAHQDNDEGDGGYSWRRHVTRRGTTFDRHPASQLTELTPIDPRYIVNFIEEDAHQLPNPATSGEEAPTSEPEEPAPESDENYEQPFSEESPDEDETQALRRQAELARWLAKERQNLGEFHDELSKEVEIWKRGQHESMKRLEARRNFINFCTMSRNTMQEFLADVIFNLPLPDHEKTEYQKPLDQGMEEWLKCERCKVPKMKIAPGQQPQKAWP